MTDLRNKLTGEKTVFGTWIAMGNPISAEIMAKAGYDFVIVDTQHGGISVETALPLLQIFEANNVFPLVRVNWLDPSTIMRAVDIGAAGVVVPMVSTAEQAKLAATCLRYPPNGFRSFGPVRNYYSTEGVNAKPLCLVMVETAEALKNLEEIAAVPEVDGILVGPVDLALSIGLNLSLEMPPPIFDVIDRIVEVCYKNNILSASAALSTDNARELSRRGVQLVAAGSDNLFVRRGASEDLEQLRK